MPGEVLTRPARRLLGLHLSPRAFALLSLAVVWALALTIVSGAAVRLTGSGLGCPTWPSCTGHSVVAPWQFHAWVEFANRLFNAAISVGCVLVALGAWRRSPRRGDLLALSGALVVGLLAEVVLGGLTVLHKLAPGFVMAHFLLGAVFLATSVVLYHRARWPDAARPGPGGWAAPSGIPVRLVGPAQVWLSRLMVLLAASVVTLGTVVTSTGPHGGSPQARRFGFSLHDVAQVHGSSVEVFLGVVLVMLWSLIRSGAPRPVLRRGEILLGVLVVQGAIGYGQYLSGDPAAVVGLHVAGAVALIAAVVWFHLGLSARSAPAPLDSPVTPAAALAPSRG